MTRVENGIEGVMRGIMVLLACALIAAVLLNAANVVDRYVFGQAIVGAEEVQIYLMIWITFLGAAVVSWRNRHLRMDVLVRHLPPWLQRTVAIIDRLLLLAIAGFVTVQSFRFVRQMLVIDRRSEAADIRWRYPIRRSWSASVSSASSHCCMSSASGDGRLRPWIVISGV